MAWRNARVREPLRREPDPLRGLSAQAERLQRDEERPQAGAGHPRHAGLHRCPVRRSRQGVLPDRHQPVRGAQGDQPGQARRGPGDGGLRAVRLRAQQRLPHLRCGADRLLARQARRARGSPARDHEQVRQRADGRRRRRRQHRNDHQRRQLPRHRQVLRHGTVPEPRVPRSLAARRQLSAQRRHDHRQRPRRPVAGRDAARSIPTARPATASGSRRWASTRSAESCSAT